MLGRYPFDDVPAAYQNLMALATEKIRFLSTRRCRHFLAAIAPRLLAAIAATPEPDTTLVNLSRVSDSLGGKAALWELFSTNRPSLNLYVTLCAACPYLAGILTSNPGMIDELMDSLLVEHLPTLAMLEESLAELCKGAEDIDPILHSFKNAQHLRVGVRDVLGKDDIRSTHAALADIAEACLKQIADQRVRRSWSRNSACRRSAGPANEDLANEIGRSYWQRFADREGDTCEPVVLALGKLGGREPNYHSDLDLIFLYEAGGQTRGRNREPHGGTINSHFFSEFGQRLIRVANHLGPHGRLYEVDARLRPTGQAARWPCRSTPSPATSPKARRSFGSGRRCAKRGRVIGNEAASRHAMEIVAQAAFGTPWRPEFATEIREMRMRLEETASQRNLKRGPGGTVDTEFLVQMLQLKHGGDDPSIRVPGTLDALDRPGTGRLSVGRRCRVLPPELPLPAKHRSPHPPDGRHRPARAARQRPRTGEAGVSARLLQPASTGRRSRAHVRRKPRALQPHLRRGGTRYRRRVSPETRILPNSAFRRQRGYVEFLPVNSQIGAAKFLPGVLRTLATTFDKV